MSEAEDLRARAARCRHFAEAYVNDVGSALAELAVELDKKADRLDPPNSIPWPPAESAPAND